MIAEVIALARLKNPFFDCRDRNFCGLRKTKKAKSLLSRNLQLDLTKVTNFFKQKLQVLRDPREQKPKAASICQYHFRVNAQTKVKRTFRRKKIEVINPSEQFTKLEHQARPPAQPVHKHEYIRPVDKSLRRKAKLESRLERYYKPFGEQKHQTFSYSSKEREQLKSKTWLEMKLPVVNLSSTVKLSGSQLDKLEIRQADSREVQVQAQLDSSHTIPLHETYQPMQSMHQIVFMGESFYEELNQFIASGSELQHGYHSGKSSEKHLHMSKETRYKTFFDRKPKNSQAESGHSDVPCLPDFKNKLVSSMVKQQIKRSHQFKHKIKQVLKEVKVDLAHLKPDYRKSKDKGGNNEGGKEKVPRRRNKRFTKGDAGHQLLRGRSHANGKGVKGGSKSELDALKHSTMQLPEIEDDSQSSSAQKPQSDIKLPTEEQVVSKKKVLLRKISVVRPIQSQQASYQPAAQAKQGIQQQLMRPDHDQSSNTQEKIKKLGVTLIKKQIEDNQVAAVGDAEVNQQKVGESPQTRVSRHSSMLQPEPLSTELLQTLKVRKPSNLVKQSDRSRTQHISNRPSSPHPQGQDQPPQNDQREQLSSTPMNSSLSEPEFIRNCFRENTIEDDGPRVSAQLQDYLLELESLYARCGDSLHFSSILVKQRIQTLEEPQEYLFKYLFERAACQSDRFLALRRAIFKDQTQRLKASL